MFNKFNDTIEFAMKEFFIIVYLILLLNLKCVLNEVQYSDSFIAFYDGPVDEQNFNILKEYGYIFDSQINIGTGFYKFVRQEGRKGITTKGINEEEELQRKDPKLLSFQQERVLFLEKYSHIKYRNTSVEGRSKRAVTVSDSSWPKQWHLAPSHTPSMGVYNVWDSGYTGKGVTVALVDDGIETNHSDLAANHNASLSIDILRNVSDPSHKHSIEGHGTNCAGIVAAVKNTKCVIGTAYEASISAIRVLDDIFGVTDSQLALALVHKLPNIDIYSNSWGPTDTGTDFVSILSPVTQAALVKGVTDGREGKGVIYVFAAGNGGLYYDDCNVNEYANSMYTIAVNSLAPDSSPAWYTEQCTSVMVATYGGDDTQDTIATTGRNDTCIENFEGTSAATPVASGIIALVLQANPELTWRDIQHMIVEYSIKTGLKNANFYTNGAGKKVSLSHGFGLMNAERMVYSASTWQTVPSRVSCEGLTSFVYKSYAGTGTISATYDVDRCTIKYLEHLLVTISFESLYREYTSIYLVSPNGTSSRLLRQRYYDSSISSVTWTFMSVHTWGEKPTGRWTLQMQSSLLRNQMNLYTWKLDLHGTVTKPVPDAPADGSLGGYCDGSTPCISSTHQCDLTAHLCLSCDIGYHAINGSCIQDGILGGFCNGSTPCISSIHRCNLPTNRCVTCGTGYHIINTVCVQDGSLGGYCNESVSCISSTHLCNLTANICEACDIGYHAINGSCIQDGSLGGFCNGSTPCISSIHRCNLPTNRCVTCGTGYHIINTVCVQDGSLGGYCNGSVSCISSTHLCNITANICEACDIGYHAINGSCIQDGSLGGYCDLSTTCISSTDLCNPFTNRCVSCDTGDHAINGVCIPDGSLGGYCNESISCWYYWYMCNQITNRCVLCDYGYSAINGYCIQDGVLGGYCDSDIPCVDAGSGCDNTSLTCVTCDVGYRVINNFCEQAEESTSLDKKDNVIVSAVIGGLVGVVFVAGVILVAVKFRIGATSAVAPAPS